MIAVKTNPATRNQLLVLLEAGSSGIKAKGGLRCVSL